MSIDKILHYVGKIGYARGKEYYNSGSLLSYSETSSEILAVLKGAGKEKFTVKISLDRNRDVKISECTCPLWDRCKHIAAVLIHYYHVAAIDDIISIPTGNQVLNKYDVYPVDYQGEADKGIQNLVDSIANKYISPKIENDTRIWKLFFRIKYIHTEINEALNWEIAPVLRYLKKDGEWGNIYKYTPKKKINALSEEEQAILYRLLENDEYKDKLIYFIEFFIANPSLPLLFISGYNYYPVLIKMITCIKLSFLLTALEKKKIAFTPCLEFFYGDEKSISTKDKQYYIFKYGSNLYCMIGNGLLLVKEYNIPLAVFIYALHNKVLYAPDILFIQDFIHKQFPGEIEIDFTTTSIKIFNRIPEPIIELSSDIIGNTNINFNFKYEGKECAAGSFQNLIIININEQETTAIRRNYDVERRLIAFFTQLVKDAVLINHYKNTSAYQIKLSVTEFIIQFGTILFDNGFLITMGKNKRLSKSNGKLSLLLKSGVDWFDLEVKYQDNEGKIEDIRFEENDLRAGIIRVNDTYILLNKEDIESIKKFQVEGINPEGKLKIAKFNFPFIEEFHKDIAADNILEIHKYREVYIQLKNVDTIPQYEVPHAYKCILRNYQKEGYNWLRFLCEYSINGCLADDMGLGKTIQTLALIQYLKENSLLGLILLVVPVTVIPNWENELKRFTKDITYVRHAGKNRSYDPEFFLKFDIILLSYHTLRIDIEFFSQFEFNFIILDESQNIKNAFTQTFKAIKMLKSKHRLALTGTPVENNTLELWSQMEFLNPGLLRSIAEFKRNFALPIEEHGDREVSLKLKKLISPFILRRKKEDVINDLPEKEILVCYAEMHLIQRKAYAELKDYYQGQIKSIISKKGIKRSRLEIFNAILRLRQMVLFPELVSSDYHEIESCKFEVLKEMLVEILAENHKVLIFSQFVTVLQIIRSYLEHRQIQYCYLDGTTQKRELVITQFQEDPGKKIFLLSLKAGGTGINLTAADYVILFDPWWNPAVEIQAIDRSHRIGQTKKVIAYKMIVKNSIEEKIMNLQNKKAELVNKIISEDKNVFKFLSEDDIIQLFQ